jgi:DNA-binding beta-propeller fold protein YncE
MGVLLVVGSQGVEPGQFFKPRAIAVAPDGRFYVVDRSGRIQRFDREGNLLDFWFLPAYEYGQPVGLALEKEGTLLVNDTHYQRILRYSPDGSRLLASWGSLGSGPGQFTIGRDVTVDAEGNIYAGDYTAGVCDRIQKFSPRGEFLGEWGGSGSGPGELDRPQGMAIERRDGSDFLLVADCNNHRIQRFDLEGRFVSTWGELGREPGKLRYPMSVAVAGSGEIYVAEWGNNRVQKFDARGQSLGTWGRPGRETGELLTPWDIAVGPAGRLYVVDYGNHRVQVFRWPETEVARGDLDFAGSREDCS